MIRSFPPPEELLPLSAEVLNLLTPPVSLPPPPTCGLNATEMRLGGVRAGGPGGERITRDVAGLEGVRGASEG